MYFTDLIGMIDLTHATEKDEESGELIKYCKDNNVTITKFVGAGFGDHRFTGGKKDLLTVARTWYREKNIILSIKYKGYIQPKVSKCIKLKSKIKNLRSKLHRRDVTIDVLKRSIVRRDNWIKRLEDSK